jgi:hypothetical protein
VITIKGMTLREALVDAKKAAGAAIVAVGAALTAGLIDDAVAAEIVGIAGLVTTIAVYLLNNFSPTPPDNVDKPAEHQAEHAAQG